jgi:meso-butanediol dehydrogenase / (S,S)-butanediol dehydrogenase / diacetyl reductase
VPTVLITGAGRGIGRACVDAFAATAWDVVAVSLRQDEVDELHEDLPEAAVVTGDVADPGVNQAAVALAVDRFGGLDAAVGNAGINLPKRIDDTSADELERLWRVNVLGLVHLAKAAHAALAERRGSLTVMASKTGLVAQRDSPYYCATKGAAVQLARALALDCAPEGIRVNALCPGVVDTPMVRAFAAAMPDPAAAFEAYSREQPLGRLATPAECAAVALFLASEAASFVTGVALPVDGGFTAQ